MILISLHVFRNERKTWPCISHENDSWLKKSFGFSFLSTRISTSFSLLINGNEHLPILMSFWEFVAISFEVHWAWIFILFLLTWWNPSNVVWSLSLIPCMKNPRGIGDVILFIARSSSLPHPNHRRPVPRRNEIPHSLMTRERRKHLEAKFTSHYVLHQFLSRNKQLYSVTTWLCLLCFYVKTRSYGFSKTAAAEHAHYCEFSTRGFNKSVFKYATNITANKKLKFFFIIYLGQN